MFFYAYLKHTVWHTIYFSPTDALEMLCSTCFSVGYLLGTPKQRTCDEFSAPVKVVVASVAGRRLHF